MDENTKLTGGAKFGYFALGFFLALIGVLIAYLINKDKPVKGQAIKMAVIGFVVEIVISIVFTAALIGLGVYAYM